MAEALKVLGQLDCPATTLTDLYTVPALTSVTVSSIVVCNRTSSSKTFRLTVAPAGAADDPKHYIYYDLTVLKNDTFIATVGLTLAAAAKMRAYASAIGLSFSLFGVEVT
jgi:hypothetical protein